ncbi:protein CUP-SHAPED COTYLEDON 1-like [Pistacia vera]|uniref:protein CUP-SHAPED COTYLEDON 1-like n=1 Tax=Pistacia vera TaxID=55513 RepID=UPI001263D9A3|nr:protein CUP-SHAPED COTYLEDON 1-like [Pistacia vera]
MSATLPPDYKFVPSDAELIGFYLYNKVHNLPFSRDTIPECDLYGRQEPWQIWEMYEGPKLANQDLYFFTLLKKKSNKGSRICRGVGSGTWQGEDGAKEIKFEKTHLKIGLKKRFRYESKGSEHNGDTRVNVRNTMGLDNA